MKKLLFILILLFTGIVAYGKNIVITSIQPLYSLVSILTEGTDIESYTPFESDVSMTTSREAMKEENFNLDIAKKAQAVVDIAHVWPEDMIYAKARLKNIHIIEIDASHNYDDKKPTLFVNEYKSGKINPYIWMSSKNLIKMANLIAEDLEKIYPKNSKKIENNLRKFSKELLVEEKNIDKRLLDTATSEVISLSENLNYFLNDQNIYTEYYDYSKLKEENVKDIIEQYGIKTIVSDRWVKKKVIKAIENAGGTFVYINTLDIPYDKDGKMDPQAILKVYRENSDALLKGLNH